MREPNILLLGVSGVGKSTLINAFIGDAVDPEELANAGYASEGIGRDTHVRAYKCEDLGFNLIDTIGFEPAPMRRRKAVKAVNDWTHDGIAKGDENKSIDAVWFCVSGTAARLFDKDIEAMSHAVKAWKNVPVIVVITKSYSKPDQEENVKMVNRVLAKQSKPINLKDVIPVVAMPFRIDENTIVAPTGLNELIDRTLEVIPEGKRAKQKAISEYKLKRNRIWAHSVVAASAAGAVTVGAVPIPFADAALLEPLEKFEIDKIAKIYGIGKNKAEKDLIKTLIEIGTVGPLAKALLDGIKGAKLVPGVSIAADVLNAIVAGGTAIIIGEMSQLMFEQIYLGNKKATDSHWIKTVTNSTIQKKASKAIDRISELLTKKTIEMPDVLNLVKAVFVDRT